MKVLKKRSNLFLNTPFYRVVRYVIPLALTIYSCDFSKTPEPTTLSVPVLMAKQLEDSLKNKPLGYAFVIYEGTQLMAQGAGGMQAQTVDIGGAKNFTVDTKFHIASMTKTLTAMAFLKAAQQKNIRSADRIAPYLPTNWVKGSGIEQITFTDLLTHRSGIIGLGDNCNNGAFTENVYSGLRQLIAKGVNRRGDYCYQNANFGLFRVLIPSILGYKFTGDDTVDNTETQQRYLTFLQQEIFDKVNISNITTLTPTNNLTFTYNYPVNTNQVGWNPGNFASTLGGYGIYLTAAEATKVFAHAFTTTDILTAAQKDTLLSKRFGSYRITTSAGSYYYHDGWWYSSLSANGQGLRTIWMNFYGNVTCVLFVNALRWQGGSLVFPFNYGDIAGFVLNAYNQANRIKNGRVSFELLNTTIEHPEPH